MQRISGYSIDTMHMSALLPDKGPCRSSINRRTGISERSEGPRPAGWCRRNKDEDEDEDEDARGAKDDDAGDAEDEEGEEDEEV